MISYKRLFERLKQNGITEYALINRYGVSPAK